MDVNMPGTDPIALSGELSTDSPQARALSYPHHPPLVDDLHFCSLDLTTFDYNSLPCARLWYLWRVLDTALNIPLSIVEVQRAWLSIVAGEDFNSRVDIWSLWRDGDESVFAAHWHPDLACDIPQDAWSEAQSLLRRRIDGRAAVPLEIGSGDHPAMNEDAHRIGRLTWQMIHSKTAHELKDRWGRTCKGGRSLPDAIILWTERLLEAGEPCLLDDKYFRELLSIVEGSLGEKEGRDGEGGSLDMCNHTGNSVCSHGFRMFIPETPTVDRRHVHHPHILLYGIPAALGGKSASDWRLIYNELSQKVSSTLWGYVERELGGLLAVDKVPDSKYLPWVNTYPTALRERVIQLGPNEEHPHLYREEYLCLTRNGGSDSSEGAEHTRRDIFIALGVVAYYAAQSRPFAFKLHLEEWLPCFRRICDCFVPPDLWGSWVFDDTGAMDFWEHSDDPGRGCYRCSECRELEVYASVLRLLYPGESNSWAFTLGHFPPPPLQRPRCRLCYIVKELLKGLETQPSVSVRIDWSRVTSVNPEEIIRLIDILETCKNEEYVKYTALLLKHLFAEAICDPSDIGPPNVVIEFLDFMQLLLDTSELGSPFHGHPVRARLGPYICGALHRLQIRLACASLGVPTTLLLDGIVVNDSEPISGGGFADVFRATWNAQIVCLKRVRIFADTPTIRRDRLIQMFYREALLWCHLYHPNVLPFVGFDVTSFQSRICLVSPWMQHGHVISYLKNNAVPPVDVDRLLFEISQGLEYLHSKNIVHGDLRGANIIINNSQRACIADFGLSRFSEATKGAYTTATREGSTRWMAPELMEESEEGTYRRTYESDVYAYGCTCLEIYTKNVPFHRVDEFQAGMKVLRGLRPARPASIAEDGLWALVERCWRQDPTERPSISDVATKMGTIYSKSILVLYGNMNV